MSWANQQNLRGSSCRWNDAGGVLAVERLAQAIGTYAAIGQCSATQGRDVGGAMPPERRDGSRRGPQPCRPVRRLRSDRARNRAQRRAVADDFDQQRFGR